jgi:Domain of unknown function (DUF4189)
MKLLSAACARTATMFAITATVLAAATGPANADAYNYWGAIAVSRQTGSTGASWDYSSAAAADTMAISECGVADCQVFIEFANACGAVAQATDGSWGWGWGWGSSLSIAESYALGGTSGSGARIIRRACTTGHR